MSKRANSVVWKYFTKRKDSKMKATCNTCGALLSYYSSTGNLNMHLKRTHPTIFSRKTNGQNGDGDDDSNSSIKFSSEIWSLFEVEAEAEAEVARCSLCASSTANTVEEMRAHLEEEHPGHMIGILNKKKDDDTDASDVGHTEPVEEDIFTDVLYLEEEKPKRKRARTRQPEQRRTSDKPARTEQDNDNKVVQYIVEKPKERPEMESFLNYISVLLKNVPTETIPKLQLDIISLILNAQMSKTVSLNNATITTPVTVLSNVNVPNPSYHITIENKDRLDA